MNLEYLQILQILTILSTFQTAMGNRIATSSIIKWDLMFVGIILILIKVL